MSDPEPDGLPRLEMGELVSDEPIPEAEAAGQSVYRKGAYRLPLASNDGRGQGQTTAAAVSVPQRYAALRVIAWIFRLAGWLFIALGVFIAGLSAFAGTVGGIADRKPEGIGGLLLAAILSLGLCFFIALLCFAASEMILVFLDLEENSRRGNRLLEMLADRLPE